jgi:hypothetical protein
LGTRAAIRRASSREAERDLHADVLEGPGAVEVAGCRGRQRERACQDGGDHEPSLAAPHVLTAE